jgi:hypothetical protein
MKLALRVELTTELPNNGERVLTLSEGGVVSRVTLR